MTRLQLSRLRFYQLLIPAAVIAMLVGVACGGAEAPASSAPSESASPTSPPAAVGATATPLPTQEPAMEEVSSEGKSLIVLTESFGNEVWDPKYESGDKHVWHFPLHSHMMTLDDDFNFQPQRPGHRLVGV